MEDKKTVVVYVTRNGSTQRYAEWIAKDCKAKLIPLQNATIDELAEYETVVFGAPVYAGQIQLIGFIKNNRDLLANSRLVVFTTGLTQPGDEVAFQQVLDRNFTEEERQGIQFFHYPGALDFKRMSFVQKNMMRILKRSILKKPEAARSQMEKYILEAFDGKLDFTNYVYVKPLVKFVKTGAAELPEA